MALLVGTNQADTLTGTSGSDTIKGLGGNDSLSGGGGSDLLYGGTGDDTFYYNAGYYSAGVSGGVASGKVFGGTGIDTLQVDPSGSGYAPFDLSGLTLNSVERLVQQYGGAVLLKTGQLSQFTHIEGNVSLKDGGKTAFSGEIVSGYFQLSDTATTFDASASKGVSGLLVLGGAAADTIIGGALGDNLQGGGGADVISGGGGDDVIKGGAGRDDLRGGAGNDTFVVSTIADAATGDSLQGGAGYDVLAVQLDSGEFGNPIDLTRFTLDSVEAIRKVEGYGNILITAAQAAAVQELSGVFEVTGTGALSLAGKSLPASAFILDEGMTDIDGSQAVLSFYGLGLYGNEGANVLTGTVREDNLQGKGGNDTLRGLSGDDHLDGGAGDDLLDGGSGNDTLTGGDGVDRLLGRTGDDTLITGEQSGAVGETYDGGDGIDTLQIGVGSGDIDLSRDTLRGIEIITADYAKVTMTTAQFGTVQQLQGHFALASGGAVSLAGKTLYDFRLDLSDAGNQLDASATSSYNNFQGGHGNDTMLGGTSVDYLFGGEGDDTLRGNAGDDQIYGDAGNDTLEGGAGKDQLTGGAGKDVMHGGAGDDVLVIAQASDIVAGETYDGGDGMDTLLLQGTDDVDIRTLPLTSIEGLDSSFLIHIKATNAQLGSFKTLGAANYVLTEGGTITFKGNVAAGTFFGAIFTMSDLGNTLDFRGATLDKVAINGGAGNDTAWASAGNDTFGLLGGNDTAYGLGGNDLIYGGAGNDKLDGGDGDDGLIGDDGTDTLIGGAGNDTLGGGIGADVQTGGTGADRFVFSSPDLGASRSATDRITDFNHAEGDIIDLSLIDANTATFGDDAFTLKSGAFTAAGQLRIVQDGGNTFIEMNLNVDPLADLVIRLDGLHTLVAGDFVL